MPQHDSLRVRLQSAMVISCLCIELFSGRGAHAQVKEGIRHRCGTSSPYVDKAGHAWHPDRPYQSGGWGFLSPGAGVASTTHAIAGTEDDPLYQTERYGPSLGYRYDGLDSTVYRVTLKLCELYWTSPGRRVFDVALNEVLVLDDLDIYALVGHDSALDTAFIVRPIDGTIVLTVPEVRADYAKLAAIAVTPGVPDRLPPGPPQGVECSSLPGGVKVRWRRNLEPDIQGYRVFRAASPTGPFALWSGELLRQPRPVLEFIDRQVEAGCTYHYAVTAVDASGNESVLSTVVAATAGRTLRAMWQVPSCAWSRPLGDYPRGATGRTKRGVPLGGIGAGNFMFNLCGTFGPWEFKTGVHEEKFLPQGAFHLFEKSGGQSASVRTLATEGLLSAWSPWPKGSGQYSALYPKAWFDCYGAKADISLKQFTPIIPHNYRETSFPVGVFQFRVGNPQPDSLDIALMFTFPNAGYADEVRTGLRSAVKSTERVTAVVMSADSPLNTSVTQGTEWCIATLSRPGAVSSCLSWNAWGDGADIYADFADGRLCNAPLDASGSAAALAVTVRLAPGEETTVPFVLSWYFPRVRFGEGTEWYRRYTEYFGTEPGHAFEVACEALAHMDEWEAQVDLWQQLIISEPCYPDWLKQAALNELYYDTFGGVFWENGCITRPEESSYGTLPPDDHKYFCMECQAYPMCETFDVRHYECRHYLELWPHIERDVLRWFADYIANDPEGKAPHDAGMPSQDPFFRFSGYGGDWQDMPSKFIQQVYAYYRKTRDEDFLNFVWPACKKTYRYMKTKDTNGNSLPDHGNTTYDTWGLVGDNLLCGGLWIGALEAMAQMAAHLGETGLQAEVERTLAVAKQVLDLLFWQDHLGYYRLDSRSTAIMADGLNGQRYCETTGLPPILPPVRMVSHLHQVFERCVAPLTDFTGDGIGDMGAVNGRNADGTPLLSGQPDEVWTGSSYFVAASMYHWGKELGDQRLMKRALQTAYGVYYQTWVNERTAYFFNTPEAWHYSNPSQYRAEQYQRPRAVWELLLEIANPFATLVPGQQECSQGEAIAPELEQNYPNPFNAGTRISYRLPAEGDVTLTVYDARGRMVCELVRARQQPGLYRLSWDQAVPSGLYVATLRFAAGGAEFVRVVKMVRLK
ncbi:MAG: GH116 family glycosyl hydrolase [candidate division KSB1 bacterium]|nr:GH116 family glycosyl hydrolase [candidate division KSB1 bacterium]